MAGKCPEIVPEERFIAVTFPEYVWKFLEDESEQSGMTINAIVRRVVDDYVRSEKGNCG